MDSVGADGAREWLNQHRNGHRFTFGRYTGHTPFPGNPQKNVSEINARRREMRNEFNSLLELEGEQPDIIGNEIAFQYHVAT